MKIYFFTKQFHLSKILYIIGFLWFFSCKETDKQEQKYTDVSSKTIPEKGKNSAISKTTKIIKDSATSNNIVFKTNTNFNNDKIKYRIEFLKNNSDNDAYDQIHFNLPVKIFKDNKLWKSNDHLIFDKRNSCISEGFNTVVVKNNYFTLEHQDCSDYNILISAYITFKVIGDEIYLYKYGESYFDKSNHGRNIPTKIWTEKNFGKIKFEDLTVDFLQKLN
jgi:hypothetical protein